MYTRKNYVDALLSSYHYKKFQSDSSGKALVAFLMESQWVPSNLTIERAIAHLGLTRSDGGSDRKDTNERRRAAQAQFDQALANAEALELTKAELDEFASLSPQEVRERYYSEDGDFFRVRYNKAARIWSFRLPDPPAVVEEAEADPLHLDATAYHAISASVAAKRYLHEPRFRRAVERLISRKEI
jgi:hypothetical protein